MVIGIPEFPGYFAGSDGHIYSCRSGSNGFVSAPNDYLRKLQGHTNTTGRYLFVCLRKDGRGYQTGVHRLVCMAFNGVRDRSMVASHLNGNCRDNRPENLIWESQKDNLIRGRFEHGNDDCGSRNSRALFDVEQITRIKDWIKEGVKLRDIAERMGTHDRNIGRIKRGERYKR